MYSVQMMQLSDKEKWNEIVLKFKNYDVYYFLEYVRTLMLHGDGDPLLFYFKNEDSQAMNVVLKRDIADDKRFKDKIPSNEYFDLITPYGYGGFIGEGNVDWHAVNSEYVRCCEENGIISEFVRFHPILNNVYNVSSMYEVVKLGRTVSIDLTDREMIWKNLSSENRNRIRNARKHGLVIEYGCGSTIFNVFYALYTQTMLRDNADEYYFFDEIVFSNMFENLRDNATVFYAKKDGEIISAAIILHANGQLHYHLSGTNADYKKLASNNLLLYEVALWGNQNGYKTFHLGGGLGCATDGLYRFKKTFNRNEPNDFYIGRKVFNEQKYGDLLAIRNLDPALKESSTYFPVYRNP